MNKDDDDDGTVWIDAASGKGEPHPKDDSVCVCGSADVTVERVTRAEGNATIRTCGGCGRAWGNAEWAADFPAGFRCTGTA